MGKGEIASQALAGNLLGDPATRKFHVLLPPSYEDGGKRYPVVYVLHYYGGHAIDLLGPIRRAYERGLAEGKAQEMIFVFPDAWNMLGGSMYLSSPSIGDYETYLTQELVAQIDATYRTIPDRASRGITGCSMGGDGSIYLALKYPEVFSVAAPVSGGYDWARDPTWELGTEYLQTYGLPEDTNSSRSLPWQARYLLALAAAAAPNADAPPFYLDMPVAVVDGEAQIVTEVFDRIATADPVHEVEDYLAQPERLNGILIYHGTNDSLAPIEIVRDFDRFLSDRGIEHEFLEVDAGHCNFGYHPVVQFMAGHLAFEMAE